VGVGSTQGWAALFTGAAPMAGIPRTGTNCAFVLTAFVLTKDEGRKTNFVLRLAERSFVAIRNALYGFWVGDPGAV